MTRRSARDAANVLPQVNVVRPSVRATTHANGSSGAGDSAPPNRHASGQVAADCESVPDTHAAPAPAPDSDACPTTVSSGELAASVDRTP